jgi:hypothetical protein
MAKAKSKTVTLQLVMSDREIELLERLAEKLKVPKSQILVESARLAIESC